MSFLSKPSLAIGLTESLVQEPHTREDVFTITKSSIFRHLPRQTPPPRTGSLSLSLPAPLGREAAGLAELQR